jgi:peptide-methionine (S)-S-oxide reductase
MKRYLGVLLVMGLMIGYVWVTNRTSAQIEQPNEELKMADHLEVATFGGGCFWCVEAIYQDVIGVHKVVSGYMGGTVENPTYKQVCTGTTGHAEVLQITFDPGEISYEDLLTIFWHTHDPTTLNRQGNDAGTQYRSVIFYHSEQQKGIAEKSKKETDVSKLWPNPIVTEISPAPVFYPAEEYHQNYFKENPYQPYCMMVIHPKVQKFRKSFQEKLKQ